MPYRIHRAALTTLAVTLTGSLVAGAADARAGTDKEARATIRNLAIDPPMLYPSRLPASGRPWSAAWPRSHVAVSSLATDARNGRGLLHKPPNEVAALEVLVAAGDPTRHSPSR